MFRNIASNSFFALNKATRAAALVIAVLAIGAPAANAEPSTKDTPAPTPESLSLLKMTCFCKLSWQDISGQCHPNNSPIALDLTGTVNMTFSWPRTKSKTDQCASACSYAAAHTGLQTLADQACHNGVGSGTVLRAFSAVGDCGSGGKYATVQTLGTLINTPEVTQTTCRCPAGWAGDNGIAGGITTNENKCSKLACQPINGVPYPPNDTKVGAGTQPWGFSWGNAFYAFGTDANGGAATCKTSVVSPAVCKIQTQ